MGNEDLQLGKFKDFHQLPTHTPILRGWMCPKCGRIWANWIMDCQDCNKKVDKEENEKK